MPANTTPIFTNTPKISWNTSNPLGTSAITGTDVNAFNGTSGTYLILTAGSNGSYVQKLICEPGGTNAVSVLRLFVNNGSTVSTATNNTLYLQFGLPAVTAVNNNATAHLEIPLMLQLPATYRLYAQIGAAANLASGWFITSVHGDY